MKATQDQSALLLYAFSALPQIGMSTAFLTGFLATIIYITTNDAPGHRLRRRILTAVYLAAAFAFSPLLCFSPAVLYTLLLYEDYTGICLIFLLCLYQWHRLPASFPFFLIPGYAMAGLLAYKTALCQTLASQYRRVQDDSTELTLLLKKKNQALLKSQDYEIYTATLKERNRIAREIHDHVGHMLSRSILLTGAIKTINTDPAAGQPLEHLEETLNTAMDNIRESIHDLHDESVNLRDVLDGLAASHASCLVTLDYDMGYDIPRDVKYCLIAIVKEALHNIAQHSDARKARIAVREHPGLYQLSVEDDGTPGKLAGHSGMGLVNMRERTHALGGNMQIYTNHGFRIFITIPKQGKESKHGYNNY